MTNPTREQDPIEFRMGALLSDIRSRLPETDSPASKDEYIGEIRELVEAGLMQAREDAFNIVRDALKDDIDDRWTFLQYCLNGWIECGAQGFLIVEHDAGLDDADLRNTPGLPPNTERRAATVTAINQGDDYYDDGAVKQILASGKVCAYCGIPLKSDGAAEGFCPMNQEGDDHKPEQAVFEVTHETIELGLQRIRHATNVPDTGTGNWERNLTSVKHLGQGLRDAIIQADLTNEATQLDVWGYTMIVEVAIFGEGVYS